MGCYVNNSCRYKNTELGPISPTDLILASNQLMFDLSPKTDLNLLVILAPGYHYFSEYQLGLKLFQLFKMILIS